MAVPTVVTPRTTVYAKRRKMVIYIYTPSKDGIFFIIYFDYNVIPKEWG